MAEEKVTELLAAMDEVSARYPLDPALSRLEVAVDAFRTPTPVTEDVIEAVHFVYQLKVREYEADFRREDKPDDFWEKKYGTRLHSTSLGEKWALRTALDQVAALSASPSPPKADGPGEVSVEPLEWSSDDYDDDVRTEWFAVGLVGQYLVHHRDGDWRLVLDYASGDEMLQTYLGAFDTDSAAKAAAQSDYEARIWSALVSPSIKREA